MDLPPKGGSHETVLEEMDLPPEGGSHETVLEEMDLPPEGGSRETVLEKMWLPPSGGRSVVRGRLIAQHAATTRQRRSIIGSTPGRARWRRPAPPGRSAGH